MQFSTQGNADMRILSYMGRKANEGNVDKATARLTAAALSIRT
jgi:hypothetical protein